MWEAPRAGEHLWLIQGEGSDPWPPFGHTSWTVTSVAHWISEGGYHHVCVYAKPTEGADG